MDEGTTRLAAEADHLVRRAASMAARAIPADAPADGRCTPRRGWMVAMRARPRTRALREPCPHCGVRGW